jgi:hypothetical protein
VDTDPTTSQNLPTSNRNRSPINLSTENRF